MAKYTVEIPFLEATLQVESVSIEKAVTSVAERFAVLPGLTGKLAQSMGTHGWVSRTIPTQEKIERQETEAPPCADYLTGTYDGPCPSYCAGCKYKVVVKPTQLELLHPLGKE